MTTLWTENKASFQGKHVSFGPVNFEPKCYQQPHVPIWIGGTGKRPMRRLLEFGSGWAPMVGDVPTLTRQVAEVKEQLRGVGRDPEKFDFACGISFGDPDPVMEKAAAHVGSDAATERLAGTKQEVLDLVERYRAAGFTHLSVSSAWEKPADLQRKLTWFADNVMRELPA